MRMDEFGEENVVVVKGGRLISESASELDLCSLLPSWHKITFHLIIFCKVKVKCESIDTSGVFLNSSGRVRITSFKESALDFEKCF